MSGVEDLEDDTDMVDTRRDPGNRLNTRVFTVIDGSAGIFLRMIGFCFLLFDVLMVVLKKRKNIQHV